MSVQKEHLKILENVYDTAVSDKSLLNDAKYDLFFRCFKIV